MSGKLHRRSVPRSGRGESKGKRLPERVVEEPAPRATTVGRDSRTERCHHFFWWVLGRIYPLECESLLSLCFVELAPRSRPGKPCWPGHSARSKLSHSRTGFLRKYREQDRPETTRKSGHTPACGRSGRESRLSTRAGSFAVLEFGLMGSGGRFGQEPDEVDGL